MYVPYSMVQESNLEILVLAVLATALLTMFSPVHRFNYYITIHVILYNRFSLSESH